MDDNTKDYIKRLILSIREQIDSDPVTVQAKKDFGACITVGKWMDVSILCSVVEEHLYVDSFKQESDNWLFKTLEWLSDPKSAGGITTCQNHRGIGFSSDCAICTRLRNIKGKDA